MGSDKGSVVQGAIAGVLAATAVAVWFFLIDMAQGRAFYTPNFLASGLLGGDPPAAGFESRTVIYTLIHYALFIGIGVAAAATLRRFGTVPVLLLGLVLGFLLFDLLFYTILLVAGVDILAVLGWPAVLIGNLIAGVVLLGYLWFSGVIRPLSWGRVLSEQRILREGLVAGLIGAGAVAALFFLIDMIQARPFFTPAALGSVMFYGARGLEDIQVNAATVGGYTALHVAAFLVFGWIAAALASRAEKHPPLILGAFLLFVVFQVHLVGLIAILAGWIFESIVWWSVALANLVAALAMGWYLWRRHPALRQELRDHSDELQAPAYRG